MTCQREEPRADQRRPLAGARGFFYGKSQLRPGADRKTRVAIHPCSGERARESGAFWLFHVAIHGKPATASFPLSGTRTHRVFALSLRED